MDTFLYLTVDLNLNVLRFYGVYDTVNEVGWNPVMFGGLVREILFDHFVGKYTGYQVCR